jgi:deoxyribodipyrimidine photo-lyase
VGVSDVQLVWFKRDLRVRDHEPLVEASKRGPVVPLYIVEPELWKLPDSAPQHWAFIRTSLDELRSVTASLGSPLIVRTGDAIEVFDRLQREVGGIHTIWAHEETGNDWTFSRDRSVAKWARTNRVGFRELHRDLVVRRLASRDDWGSIAKTRMARPLSPAPARLNPATQLGGLPLDPGVIPSATDLGLTTDEPAALAATTAGERHARQTLDSFLGGRCAGYEKKLSSPISAWDGCSRLSAHLTFGTISLREVMARTRRAAAESSTNRFSLKAFEERLHWRSHFVQKLEDEPSLEQASYVRSFDGVRLDPASSELAAERFAAWTEGRTGYPMVDACMRSLNATGWINFRMRAMLVSFASYDLWLDWRCTAPFLARAFVDYEPGIHYPQVQMQSGTTGINTIRIYEPVKQGLDHDPGGDFVRRWVPELQGIDGAAVHQPWLGEGSLWGVPSGYPSRIVDHASAVASAWKTIDRLKGQARRNGTSAQVLERHGSRRPPPETRRTKVAKSPKRLAPSLFRDDDSDRR